MVYKENIFIFALENNKQQFRAAPFGIFGQKVMKAMTDIFLAPFKGMTKKQRVKAIIIGISLALVFCGVWSAAIPLVYIVLPNAKKSQLNVKE